MEYKVTYYVLPINDKAVINKELYHFMIHEKDLQWRIDDLENHIEKVYDLYWQTIDGKVTLKYYYKSSNDSHTLKLKSEHDESDKVSLKGKDYNQISLLVKLLPRISLQEVLKELQQYKYYETILHDKYFDENRISELNQHISENAKDGWRLIQIQPINKNVRYFIHHGPDEGASDSIAQIQEGFILFWERV